MVWTVHPQGALALMTRVLGTYYYELHTMDEKAFNDFLIGKWK